MSSRLNPRDYDLGELRDAVRERQRGGEDGPEDEPWDGRPDGLSAIEDLLHEDPSDGTAGEGTADVPPEEPPTERPDAGDESVEEEADRSGDRSGDGGGDRTGSGRSGDGPLGGDRSDDSRGRLSDADRGGRSGTVSGRAAGSASAGRMRRTPARFARSASRDRTADGRPRRRGHLGDDERSGRGPTTAAGTPGRAATAREHGTGVDEFELLAAGSGGEFERPYLDRLPDSYRAQLEIFEWLEGLLGTCGWEATADALAYYESVGWLSEGAREDLEGFLEGLSAVEPPDPRPTGVDDHRESLRYVARLACRVDR